jgi:hypothetical protein
MGMYDTFEGGYQVKCFYHPIFSDFLDDELTYHSGGLLNYYRIGDAVPIETTYYEYPRDFYIVDEDDDFVVIDIQDGKFVSIIKNIEDIKCIKPFYNKYGERIKANNVDELKLYISEYQEAEQKMDFSIFNNKWFESWPDWYYLGELIECYFILKNYNDIGIVEQYIKPKEKLDKIIKEVLRIKKEKPDVFKFYIKKFKDDKVIKDILKEIENKGV